MSGQKEIRRYKLLTTGNGTTQTIHYHEVENGEWVRFDDIKNLLSPQASDESVEKPERDPCILCGKRPNVNGTSCAECMYGGKPSKLQTAKDRKA